MDDGLSPGFVRHLTDNVLVPPMDSDIESLKGLAFMNEKINIRYTPLGRAMHSEEAASSLDSPRTKGAGKCGEV